MVREGLVGSLALQTGPVDLILGIEHGRLTTFRSRLLSGPYKLSCPMTAPVDIVVCQLSG